jgi:hypothetical protein
MRNPNRKAADQDELAAHARTAAEHGEKEDKGSRSRHSERALQHQIMLLLLVIGNLAALPVSAKAQPFPDSSRAEAGASPAQPDMTRYALSAAFKQDALYYRCECTGVIPRHASTWTERVPALFVCAGH